MGREGGKNCILVVFTCPQIALSSVYEQLKEDVLSFKQKGRVVLLGDFNARVGKSVDVFGEYTGMGMVIVR